MFKAPSMLTRPVQVSQDGLDGYAAGAPYPPSHLVATLLPQCVAYLERRCPAVLRAEPAATGPAAAAPRAPVEDAATTSGRCDSTQSCAHPEADTSAALLQASEQRVHCTVATRAEPMQFQAHMQTSGRQSPPMPLRDQPLPETLLSVSHLVPRRPSASCACAAAKASSNDSAGAALGAPRHGAQLASQRCTAAPGSHGMMRSRTLAHRTYATGENTAAISTRSPAAPLAPAQPCAPSALSMRYGSHQQ
jgi:hypothetical protein